MDPEKRKFILLALIVISAVIIGLIIYFLVYYSYNNQPKNDSPLIDQTPIVVPRITNIQPGRGIADNQAGIATQTPAVDLIQEDATQVAKTFVERYGTYSNQGGQDQFTDLNLFVSDKMKTWLAGNTKTLLAGLKNYDTVYIMVTKAVSAKIISIDKTVGQATVVVSTRRSEQTGDEAPKISNKDMRVNLVKAGKRWKIDEAVWQ